MAIENLQDAYNKLKNTKWSFSNSFRTAISFDNPEICYDLGLDSSVKAKLEQGEEEVYLRSTNIPGLQQTPIQNWVNMQNVVTPSFPSDIFDIKIDFLDHDQMTIWKFFSSLFLAQKNFYPDQCKFTITVFKLPDYPTEKEHVVAVFSDCILKGVSQVDFKTSEKDSGTILEVSIDIVSPKFELTINESVFKNF